MRALHWQRWRSDATCTARPFGAFFNDVHHDDKDKFYNKLHDIPNNKGNLKRGDDIQFYFFCGFKCKALHQKSPAL